MRAEPLHRSILYPFFKRFGYRWSECARCGRKRLILRHKKDKHRHKHERRKEIRDDVAPTMASAPAVAAVPIIETTPPTASGNVEAATTSEHHHHLKVACPFCGSGDCRFSRRRFWERLTGKPKMLRCRQCRKRFPRPPRLASAA